MSNSNNTVYQNVGGFNRRSYDDCAYQQKVDESTSPLHYQMSRFKYENSSACTTDGKYHAPFDLVDFESELKNITRHTSRCNNKKYSPKCNWTDKEESCMNTFDSKAPSIVLRDICPVVQNKLRRMTIEEVQKYDMPNQM